LPVHLHLLYCYCCCAYGHAMLFLGLLLLCHWPCHVVARLLLLWLCCSICCYAHGYAMQWLGYCCCYCHGCAALAVVMVVLLYMLFISMWLPWPTAMSSSCLCKCQWCLLISCYALMCYPCVACCSGASILLDVLLDTIIKGYICCFSYCNYLQLLLLVFVALDDHVIIICIYICLLDSYIHVLYLVWCCCLPMKLLTKYWWLLMLVKAWLLAGDISDTYV
jgi:hypothetical protein